MMSVDVYLKCPFCGGEASIGSDDRGVYGWCIKERKMFTVNIIHGDIEILDKILTVDNNQNDCLRMLTSNDQIFNVVHRDFEERISKLERMVGLK